MDTKYDLTFFGFRRNVFLQNGVGESVFHRNGALRYMKNKNLSKSKKSVEKNKKHSESKAEKKRGVASGIKNTKKPQGKPSAQVKAPLKSKTLKPMTAQEKSKPVHGKVKSTTGDKVVSKTPQKLNPVAASKVKVKDQQVTFSKPNGKVSRQEKQAEKTEKSKTKVQKVTKKNELEDSLLDADSDLDLGQDEIQEYAAELELVEEEDSEVESSTTVTATWTSEGRKDEDQEVVLTDAEGRRYCRAKDCDQVGIVDGYCRYHYLLLWKKIQIRRKILTDGKLQRYVEELTSRYPDKFLEVIRKDLRSEKDFLSAIQELEIDESLGDSDYEEDTHFIEEVRGMGEATTVEDDDF